MNTRPQLLFTIFFLLVIHFSSKSQILNTEKFRIDKDTSDIWFGSIGLNFNLQKQKVDILRFGINSNIVYLSGMHSYILINNVNLVKISGKEVISKGYIYLSTNFFRKNKFSIEPFTQYQYDQNRGLNRRLLFGAGIRYSVHTTEKISIAFTTGMMYENELWTDIDTIETNYLKSTNNINFRWNFSKKLSLMFISYYQARPDHFFKPRIIADSKLLLKINNNISFSINFIASYDSAPIIPIEKFIYSIQNRIILSF